MAVDGIIANGVTEILKKLSSVVANEITLVWDFNDELKNLQTTFNMILAVMEDAEKKQVSSKVVRLWMEELKSIAFDAEDILDDYSYKLIGKRTQTGKVRKPSLFFRWRMAHKIKEINEKFNKIAKRKNDLGLQTSTIEGSSSSSHTMMMENRETYSLVAANWKIVGRENDKLKIINTLLDKNSCFVLSMVGLGGLGKTTMAQLVYNDEAVQKHFQLKIWICVSEPFDVKKLLKNIVNSSGTGEKYDDDATMDVIVHGLQAALREKKFLLVLDDVWNKNSDDWYKLKTPLMVGAEGSKILVTTRSVEVAELMVDKFPPYPLGILNDNDSWFLFKEIAFGSAVETPELVKIGKEMVGRCGGLPLAVIFLGSLMRSKKKEEEWKNIRDTKIWHESKEGGKSEHVILPSLRLSYDHLPSHLKQCFSYCCLFPKDWEIQRETLIRLWMAEGFLIESPGDNAMSMEEIGSEYFHILLSNFFFQDVKRNEDGDIVTCKIHDLVHDVARSVVGKNECVIVENAQDIDCISEATIRLNLVNVDKGMLPKVLEALKNAKNLRTVFVNNYQRTFEIGKAFNKNKRLRVLDLRHGSDYVEVQQQSHSSIGGLKHLRYLHLFYGFIIPKGIGGLRFLQTLNMFTLSHEKNAGGDIEELECLNHLRGDLTINLQNVTNGEAACRANLKEKKKLHRLNLTWYEIYDRPANAKNHEAVLEGLRPHPNLRILCINGFEGSRLPKWIEEASCLPNLVELTLWGGSYEQLAGFGALPSLRSLSLYNVSELECIGSEFYYSAAGGSSSSAGGESNNSNTASGEAPTSTTTIAFPSLKRLHLSVMHALKEWVVPPPPSTTGATYYCFPLLEEIVIKYCSQLSTITPTAIFPSLKVLKLEDIDGSAAETLVTNNLNSLTSLGLREITELISLPRQGLIENNNTLLSLEIIYCRDFNGFLPSNNVECSGGGGDEVQVSGSSLQSLTLLDCHALWFFPDIRSLTSLRQLTIRDCHGFKSLPPENVLTSSFEHLQFIDIKDAGEIKRLNWKKEN